MLGTMTTRFPLCVSLGYVKNFLYLCLWTNSEITFVFDSYLNSFLTKLLGPLDKWDMLNEAFIGLSLAPHGEDTFTDKLPPYCSIHRHILCWQVSYAELRKFLYKIGKVFSIKQSKYSLFKSKLTVKQGNYNVSKEKICIFSWPGFCSSFFMEEHAW